MNAPVFSEVYTKYRSENLPIPEFLINTLVDSFAVPRELVGEFIKVFITTLEEAQLLEEVSNGKFRVLDVTSSGNPHADRRGANQEALEGRDGNS